MQTIFPKIAATLLAICAVAFMGLSIAAFYGRPDPLAAMDAPELGNYAFSSTISETSTSWSVRQVMGDDQGNRESDATHDNPYAAVLDAYKKESKRLAANESQLTADATTLRDRITIIQTHQAADIAALEQSVSALSDTLTRQEQTRDQLSRDLQALMVETTEVRNETTDRREDVMRLQNELEELRTDKFRLEELQRILTDRLVRLQLENQALEVRLQQFQEMTSQSGSE